MPELGGELVCLELRGRRNSRREEKHLRARQAEKAMMNSSWQGSDLILIFESQLSHDEVIKGRF
jgi:hypothetical protein